RRVAAALSFGRRSRADSCESRHLGLPPEMHRAPERLTTMTVRMPDQESPPQGGASELASFGEELRREREIRGISLKEISDATKISKRFLDALERNDHSTLPAPVFTRGFVREYSRYLGLNAEEIVNRYNFAAAGDDRIEKSTHLDRLVQPQAAPLPSHRDPSRERDQQLRDRKSIPPAYARI